MRRLGVRGVRGPSRVFVYKDMQRDPLPNGDLLALVRMAVNATPAGRALCPESVALVMSQGGINGVEVACARAVARSHWVPRPAARISRAWQAVSWNWSGPPFGGRLAWRTNLRRA